MYGHIDTEMIYQTQKAAIFKGQLQAQFKVPLWVLFISMETVFKR